MSYLHVFVTTRAAAFNTCCSLSVIVFGDPLFHGPEVANIMGDEPDYSYDMLLLPHRI